MGQTASPMVDPLHDDETIADEGVVRALLADERIAPADAELSAVRSSGTDNVLWRVRPEGEADLVVRLPRTEAAANGLTSELSVLRQLAGLALPFEVPVIRHVGAPVDAFPWPWAVLDWLPGVDACSNEGRRAAEADGDALAAALATSVAAIGAIDGLQAPERPSGRRGGPLLPLLDRLDRWLDDPHWSAGDLLDLAAVRRVASSSREVAAPEADGGGEVEPSFVHGDLLPGNLLLRRGRLAALIDWGSAANADPARTSPRPGACSTIVAADSSGSGSMSTRPHGSVAGPSSSSTRSGPSSTTPPAGTLWPTSCGRRSNGYWPTPADRQSRVRR